MFEVGDSGMGPGFMYTVLPFKEIPNVRVEILDEDYEPALNLTDLKDIRFVHDSNYPELGTGHFWGDLQTVNECEHMDKEITKNNPNCQPEVISRKLFEQYITMIEMLQKYDWKRYIEPNMPRLIGQDSWKDTRYGRDGFYIDTYEKWQQYVENDDIFVMFYHKNLILQLSINTTAPHIEMYTNNFEYLFRYDEETRGEKWQEYLANDIPKWAEERQKRENELKAKGYHIQEDYQDAPLPDYKLE